MMLIAICERWQTPVPNMLRRISYSALPLLVLLLALVRPAAALSCIPMTPAEQLQRTQIVLTGTVTETSGEWAVVAVDRYYKGTGPAKVTVKSDITWGPNLAVGAPWLLYINIGERGEWNLGLCFDSRTLSSGFPLTQAETELLGPGSPPEPDAAGAPASGGRLWLWGGLTVAAGLAALLILRSRKAGRGQAE